MAKLSKSFTKNKNFILVGAVIIMLINLSVCCFTGLVLLRSWSGQPLSEPLALPALGPTAEASFPEDENQSSGEEGDSSQTNDPASNWQGSSSDGENELIFLAIAIDYRGDNYVYGLADSIRLVRVDFDEAQINVVSLPRNLLVNVPADRITAENPTLLNQSYFFGSKGMGKYAGDGYGAGALAETIQSNFGITVDHYVVIDFGGFIEVVDVLGGIEVDLPVALDDRPSVYFPAGKQVLSGEEALQLARARTNYTDLERVDHQNLVLQALFRKLVDPAVIYRLPTLANSLQDSVLTDVSPEQILTLTALLQRLEEDHILYANPPDDVITNDDQYIPSVRQEMQILRWDSTFIDWLNRSLWMEIEE